LILSCRRLSLGFKNTHHSEWHFLDANRLADRMSPRQDEKGEVVVYWKMTNGESHASAISQRQLRLLS